jgi:3-oxoacyl-[acyl-carrier protein] reductase
MEKGPHLQGRLTRSLRRFNISVFPLFVKAEQMNLPQPQPHPLPRTEGRAIEAGKLKPPDGGNGFVSRLTGKVAVVTGASKGIGAAIAKSLAAEGASVVVNYASGKAGADKVVAEIAKAGGKAVAVGADVSKAAEAQALVDAAVKAYGRLDVLVNNSGVYEFAPIGEITEAQFHRMFDVNVLGLLLTTQAAVKHLGEGASIINIGSVVSSRTPENSAVYTGTKGAVDAITGVLANELGSRKIRVNSINPGMVDTEGAQAAGVIGSDWERSVVAQTPLGRVGQVDDIAGVAVFLASNDAKWITGEVVRAGGGLR